MRGSSAFWRPTVSDPGSPTTLTLAQIRSDLAAIYDDCGEVPDLGVCNSAVFNTIANLFENNRRYIQTIQTARGTVTLDAGYQALEVDGCMFIRDKDATANQIYYINTRYVEIEYLPLDGALMSQLMDMGMVMGSNDGYGDIPLGIWCEKLGKSGDTDIYHCLTELQLKVIRPNSCGARLNVATT